MKKGWKGEEMQKCWVIWGRRKELMKVAVVAGFSLNFLLWRNITCLSSVAKLVPEFGRIDAWEWINHKRNAWLGQLHQNFMISLMTIKTVFYYVKNIKNILHAPLSLAWGLQLYFTMLKTQKHPSYPSVTSWRLPLSSKSIWTQDGMSGQSFILWTRYTKWPRKANRKISK